MNILTLLGIPNATINLRKNYNTAEISLPTVTDSPWQNPQHLMILGAFICTFQLQPGW